MNVALLIPFPAYRNRVGEPVWGIAPAHVIDVDPGCHTSPGTDGPTSAVPFPLESRTTEALTPRLTVLGIHIAAIIGRINATSYGDTGASGAGTYGNGCMGRTAAGWK